ncbi:MAG: hypothetical protein ACYSR9_06860 [Planctomycetota bacterium]|jgi:hypothetical protein
MSKPIKGKGKIDKSKYKLLLRLDGPNDLNEVWTCRINTRRDFRAWIKRNKGYIVITGKAHRNNKLHKISCSFVREDNFVTKVIGNESKNGDYFWLKDLDSVELLYGPSFCSHCMK